MGEIVTGDLFGDNEQPSLFEGGLHARHDDPQSSHEAAKRDFDIAGGGGRMADRIIDVLWLRDEWLTCRDIRIAIYGPGPYTEKQALSMNKIQTVALNLWRQHKIVRRDVGIAGHVIEYRRTP